MNHVWIWLHPDGDILQVYAEDKRNLAMAEIADCFAKSHVAHWSHSHAGEEIELIARAKRHYEVLAKLQMYRVKKK